MERNGELILVSHGDDLVLDGRENLYVFACALYERGSDERHRDFSDSLKIFFGVKTPELPAVSVAFYSNGRCRKVRVTVVAQFFGEQYESCASAECGETAFDAFT
jgi:hypothetical protein